MDLYGKNILVVGLARSGEAVALLLIAQGAHVTVTDSKPRTTLDGAVERLEAQGVPVIVGGHPLSLLQQCDWIVKNPGIRYDIPILQEAQRQGIPIVTEVEIAWAFTQTPILGITGSNGKTTTTSLVGHIFAKAGMSATVAGNIGTPLSAVAMDMQPAAWLIAELSSFQLLGTQFFRPRIAVLLNLYPSHLDYHGSMSEYIAAKANLFKNQMATDIAILVQDHPLVAALAPSLRAQVWWVSSNGRVDHGVYLRDGTIYFASGDAAANGYGDADLRLVDISEMTLRGPHNVENAMAAAAAALAVGIDPEAVCAGLRDFAGVEHRLEYVTSILGVKYVNDSKATNPQAAIRAIESYSEPVICILGGLDRGDDLTPLMASVGQHCKAVVTLGQSGPRMKEMAVAAGVHTLVDVTTLQEAVRTAQQLATDGDVVLLSPAAASWDMFDSFEERGRMFKQAVHML